MSPVKIASIGLGWVTTHRHLPVMDRSPLLDVIGVIDRQPGRAVKVANARNYRHHSESASLADVSWIDKVDAIAVGTGPMSHAEIIEEALKLGKHVITEKPFTMTVTEGEALYSLAEQQNRTLCIVHNFQFARSTQALIRDMESGKIGTVRSVRALQWGNPARRLPTWYEELPLGLFYDESPHLLYLLRRFAGPDIQLKRVHVLPNPTGKKTPHMLDAVYAGHDFDGNPIPATLHLNFESPISEWYVIVYGDKFLGMVDIFRDIYICLPNDGLHVTSTVLRTSWTATWQHWRQHVTSGFHHLRGTLFYGNETVFQNFARAVLHNDHPVGVSASDALAVLKMQHEIITQNEPVL